MKDGLDRDVDRVLKELGSVEAPLGLEWRVLQALEARQPVRGFAWGWVGVAAVLLAGILAGILVGSHEFRAAKAVGEVRVLSPAQPRQPSTVAAREIPAVEAGRPRRDSSTAFAAKSATSIAQNDAASETAAAEVGFPAPPEPLTEQEKLLLRLARRANAGTVAMFDPKIREERAEAEKAEFEFFNPPPAVITAEPEETDHVGKQVK